MRNVLHGLRLCCICIGLLPALAHAIEIESIAPGAWAALQPHELRFNDSNSLIVAADDFVIVVDAQENANDVRSIIEFAKSEIGKPIRFVVNTHWHSDHTQGNTIYRQAYGDSLTIIGHRTHTEDIPGRAAAYLQERVASIMSVLPTAKEQVASGVKEDGTKFTDEELAAQKDGIAWAEAFLADNENVEFTTPSLTIGTPFTVDAGKATFTVHPLHGHTRGDLVVHFPQLGVLATGDMVDELPYVGHGYPSAWLAALPEIDALGADIMVPGHGAVLRDRILLTRLDAYFSSLTSQVKALVRAGKDLQATLDEIDLSEGRRQLAGDDAEAASFFDQVQAEAVTRAYEEATNQIQ